MKKITIFTLFAALVSFSSCEEEEAAVPGCTDMNATNYNTSATQNDGSCVYIIPGCTDDSATNFNTNANQDDGSCEYSWAGTYDASEDCGDGFTWEQVITQNSNEITLINAFAWGVDITIQVDNGAFNESNVDGVVIDTDGTEYAVVYTTLSGEIQDGTIAIQYIIAQEDETGTLVEVFNCEPVMIVSTGGLRYSVEKKKI